MTHGDPDSPVKEPNSVTIFGAGIAGLSAAHELIERGFRVQVWEPESDPRDTSRGCDVGGLAKTQWSRVAWSGAVRSVGQFAKAPAPPGEQAQAIQNIEQTFFVRTPPWRPGDLRRQELTDRSHTQSDWPLPGAIVDGVTVEIVMVEITTVAPDERKKRADQMLEVFLARVPAKEPPPDLKFDPAAQTYGTKVTLKGGERVAVVFPVREPPPLKHHETTAVLYVWRDGALRSTCYAASRWKPSDFYGVGPSGSEVPAKISADLLGTIVKYPQIDYVYIEVTARPARGRDAVERREYALKAFDYFGSEYQLGGVKLGRFVEVRAQDGSSQLEFREDLQETSSGSLEGDLALFEGEELRRRIHIEIVELAPGPGDLPEEAMARVAFRVRERWLPGEHGHRFFPSFYHHVFDTMERTPILETVEKPFRFTEQERAAGMTMPSHLRYVETGRSVFDNLEPTTRHAIAFEDGEQPRVLTRTKVQSFEEVWDHLKVFFGAKNQGGFDADPRDTSRFVLRTLQYLTSCAERREEYSKQSWWDFVDGESYGKEFQTLLQKWPRALVAMDAKSCDARTYGNTSAQILLDLMRSGGYRDGILKGPTSEAWLDLWRRYLEAQGVEFIHGRLRGFQVIERDGKSLIWPDVACYEPRHPMNDKLEPELLAGYFVLALSAHEIARVARSYLKAAEDAKLPLRHRRSDLERAARIRTDDLFKEEKERSTPRPMSGVGNAEFRHYSGIQFYFEEDAFWWEGQSYHADSDWELTSVSQARIWSEKTDWEHGYRGVLSVIIGNWAAPSKETGLPAYEHEPEKLAAEVWRQVSCSMQGDPRPTNVGRFARRATPSFAGLPEPIYWRLDDNIEWHKPDEGSPYYRDRAPFHILPAGKWDDLPGDVEGDGYAVERGIVLAGMYMRTRTRLPCMETACESGRHAVNAILKDGGSTTHRTPCEILDPEDREVDDLAWLKDLDRKLFRRGLGHVVELYGLEKLVRFAFRGGDGDPFDPLHAYTRILKMLRVFAAPYTR